MKNKITVFGSKGIIFFCAIALAVVGLALTGCDDGSTSDDGGGGSAEFPAAWVGTTDDSWREDIDYPFPQVVFSTQPAARGVLTYFLSDSSTNYKLKSFTGDGTGTNTFKVKKQNFETGADEGSEITVTYTFTAATPPTIKLVSTDIADIGGEPGKTFTKYIEQ